MVTQESFTPPIVRDRRRSSLKTNDARFLEPIETASKLKLMKNSQLLEQRACDLVEPPLLPGMYMDAIRTTIDLMPSQSRKQSSNTSFPSIGLNPTRSLVVAESTCDIHLLGAMGTPNLLNPSRRRRADEPTAASRSTQVAKLPVLTSCVGSSLPHLNGRSAAYQLIEEDSPSFSQEATLAAKNFDDRHVDLTTEAHLLLRKAGRARSDPNSDKAEFYHVLDEIRRNRIYLEIPGETPCPAAHRSKKHRMKRHT